MPVLGDFKQIVGDSPIRIGDGNPLWEQRFDTGGRSSGYTAFLIFNVKGLTHTTDNVEVRVNNRTIGYIYPYGGQKETANRWYTQMIAMSGSTLRDGDNELEIRAVGWPGATPSNMYDDFYLKDVICFFHQST